MRILALNSSPRTGSQSKTEIMLNYLVEGMSDAGAKVEVVNLRDKKIRNCIGCFTCWTKTPGKCMHKDDMTTELFPKWLDADLVVYATPLYYHTMNGTMSTFRERTLPAAQPFFEQDDDGKTFQDHLDGQSEPGQWYPKPSWVDYDSIVSRESEELGGKRVDKDVWELNRVGEHTILCYVKDPTHLWFAAPLMIVESPSE